MELRVLRDTYEVCTFLFGGLPISMLGAIMTIFIRAMVSSAAVILSINIAAAACRSDLRKFDRLTEWQRSRKAKGVATVRTGYTYLNVAFDPPHALFSLVVGASVLCRDRAVASCRRRNYVQNAIRK